jgi:hypothetical protein
MDVQQVRLGHRQGDVVITTTTLGGVAPICSVAICSSV